MSFLERTELLIGKDGLEKLSKSKVIVIGLGGVGSYAVEALVRAGIGRITLVDGDVVDKTNINRQLQALNSTIGLSKAELLNKRIFDISPSTRVTTISKFLNPEDIEEIIDEGADFVLDCIDTVSPKINLITLCKSKKMKIISSMGAGGKMNPANIKIADINKTNNCNFSRDVRKRLRRLKKTYGVKVVYSDEVMDKNTMALTHGTKYKKSYYGTISYMPAMFGMTMASYVIRKLIED